MIEAATDYNVCEVTAAGAPLPWHHS